QQRQRLAGEGEVPAHQHHQAEAEEQEEQAGDGVLDADHLVIGGKDVVAPETERVMLVPGVVAVGRRGLRMGVRVDVGHRSELLRRCGCREPGRCRSYQVFSKANDSTSRGSLTGTRARRRSVHANAPTNNRPSARKVSTSSRCSRGPSWYSPGMISQ